MKKVMYLTSSTILGVLLTFLIHAGLEILALKTIVPIIEWNVWKIIHTTGSIVLFVTGALGGLFVGKYWTEHYKFWSYIGFKKKRS